MTHSLAWADGGVAGVKCAGKDAGTLMSDSPPEPCVECGALLRLHWDVRVEECAFTPPQDAVAG